MTTETEGVQQAIAASASPAAEFADLSRRRQVEVFFSLPETVQQSLLTDMDVRQVRRFVRRLDPDEGADVLGLVDEETRTEVLRRLDEDRRDALSYLLEFDPETAAGLMHLDYVTVDVERSLADAARRVERFEERNDDVPTIFVVDDEEFVGELPGQALALAGDKSERLRDHVEETPVVTYDTPDTEVVDVFRRAPERSVAVLDDDRTILGVIYAGDLLRVIEEEASETLYEFTGVQEEESILDGPLTKVRYRYKWLIINLGTAFLAAAAVGVFEDTIAAFTLLAVYMPVVAGMGGNAGTQSMAVTVRGIALGQISLPTGRRAVVNEAVAGAANGLITGVLVAVIATVFNQSPLLGLVLGVSMVLNLVIAGFFGTIIPLVLDRVGKDPATSATIFITTATDVLGFFIFLGLAQNVL
ncbi:magnesium transporter [Halogeometricum rufum]|uniref:Magnesium transporter n=1 Tax=Halogeometricum rufum TaxID=553469 RepID=A0A1I6GM24_9EURY|nr:MULTISPECIES: magnesium transporter [Halogeometricum]MUV56275.1 magnesium transporter [Halogeometricum sp. CBA1124]SFR43228.1 magnesium transporter [Halogeometricum rufum]